MLVLAGRAVVGTGAGDAERAAGVSVPAGAAAAHAASRNAAHSWMALIAR